MSSPTVFIPRESRPGETRVAAVPETVRAFKKLGLDVCVERGAGASAFLPDQDLEHAGARLLEPDAVADAWRDAALVLKVQPPTLDEVQRLAEGAVLVSTVFPARHTDEVAALRDRRVTTLAADLVPRITRAQSMDVLSSQATVAGYKAVLLAAVHLGKLCPLLMTAAGTIPPARVVIFGAGVAGLQAIATARRLGCVVEATDVRLAVKEQVESLGGRFIEVEGAEDLEGEGGYAKEASADFLRRQREEVARRVADADAVITTAQVPGKRAPVLVDEDMLRAMRPGSVVVDLAVESGGNCALSERGQIVQRHDVTIVGVENLPATVPLHASELFAKNLLALLKPFVKKSEDGAASFELDYEDEVIAGCLLTRDGTIRHAPTAELFAAEQPEHKPEEKEAGS